MNSKAARAGLVWGTALILLGILSLLDLFVEVSAWIWIIALVVASLLATGLWLRDRSDKAMMLASYVLWAVTLLVILVTLNILRDEGVAFFVLLVIALPFLVVYYRDRAQWWALIPAYVLIAVAVMVGLIGLGVLDDLLVPTYVMFAIALPFFYVYLRDRSQWWPLIPGGIMALIGLGFLFASDWGAAFGALLLIGLGALLLLRGFRRSGSADEASIAEPEAVETPEPEAVEIPVPEADEPPAE